MTKEQAAKPEAKTADIRMKLFNTRRSAEITRLVGKPVFYTTYEMD